MIILQDDSIVLAKDIEHNQRSDIAGNKESVEKRNV
jgi:hypothetical protein